MRTSRAGSTQATHGDAQDGGHGEKDEGIAIGAHRATPDLQRFSRRDMNLSPDEACSYMLCQIGALQAFLLGADVRLAHT